MGQKHDKKLWTSQEDECLKKAIQAIGDEKWNEISIKFNQIFFSTYGFKSNRLGKQCRQRYTFSLNLRWYNKLSPALGTTQEEWTPEQHDIMIDAYKKFGSRWSKIIQLLFDTFAIRRSDNGIKNHFHTLIKKGMKQLNQFVDQYNEECKRKGLFEQKPKKKYFYPKQLSIEKELRIKKKNPELFSQQPPEIAQKTPDQEQVQPIQAQNGANNQIEDERAHSNNSEVGAGKQTLIIQKQEEGTTQKIDSMKSECTDTVNTERIKYLTPLKALDKKIADRLLFVVLDQKFEDPQFAEQMLPEEQSFLSVRGNFLEYIKNSTRFTFQQTRQLAEGLSNYTHYLKKVGKKLICSKKPKKVQPELSYLDIHRTSRKLFQKIKKRYPDHQKAFSVGRHKILARINVLVTKTRQRQLDMQEEIQKKYFLRKEEQEIIVGYVLQEAVHMYKTKKEQTKKKKQDVWHRKKILKQEQLQKQKQQFLARGGTAEQFETIQQENRRLKTQNLRLKAKIKSQQNELQKASKRRRIIRSQVPKTKPIRKNKQDHVSIFHEPSHHMNRFNEFSFGQQDQQEQLMKQAFSKIQFPQHSDNKDSQNIFPFLSNRIREIPMESYNFFDDLGRVAQFNEMHQNHNFFDNIRSVPIEHQTIHEVKQEFSQQEAFNFQPVQTQKKWNQNLILKTQNQKQSYALQPSRIPAKQQQVEDSIKKYPSSELIFKIPLKRPLQEKHIESQNSSHSLKSKKSIRPKILIRQEQSKPQLSSSSFLKKQTQPKQYQKKDSGFQPIKKDFPDFLARSIELAAQQNELNRSWKFNIQPDSPINSNKSNFFAFVPEVKNQINQSQTGNLEFFKQLNNSQEFIGPNIMFNKGSSTNYNNANQPQSIYKSRDFMAMSCQNLGQQKVPGQNKPNGEKYQENRVQMNSFLRNIRKIEESEGSQWKEPKVYNFMDSIPQKVQKQTVQTPVSNNTNRGFSAFNLFNSQPIDFEIPQKLIETAKNTNFPIRNYNDYSLNYQHANSMEFSKVFEFDKKFGFNSAIFSEMELLKSQDRNEENRSRSKQFELGSNMFKSQRIQSLHESCGYLNKSRQLSNSCIYSNHDEKSIVGGKQQPDNMKNSWNNPQKMYGSSMQEEQKPKKIN